MSGSEHRVEGVSVIRLRWVLDYVVKGLIMDNFGWDKLDYSNLLGSGK